MHQFSPLYLPSSDHIPLAVSALQHIPFRIDGSGSLLPSLVILSQNNQYWQNLGAAAKRTRQWTIPVVMNIIWVLVAFLLTIVDSFVDFDNFVTLPGDAGYSITAMWTYLLPLIVGWLQVGSQPEANHLRRALDDANNIAYMATTTEPALATHVTYRPTYYAIEYSTKHDNSSTTDEEKTAPIFNCSRVFIWSQSAEYISNLCKNAAAKAVRRTRVKRGKQWRTDARGASVARNWIGNEAEVVQYCMTDYNPPVDPNSRGPQPLYSAFPPSPRSSAMTATTHPGINDSTQGLLHRSSGEDEEAPPTRDRALPEKPVFAMQVFCRVAYATALALGLQWGTTGAAVLIHLNTPPKGMGCRAMSFTVYGAAATVAFLLLLFSSILSHLARRQNVDEKRSGLEILTGYIAALTRWLGKVIAFMNGLGILLSCIMQFAGVYDSCFCSSIIFGGDPNGLVSFTAEDIKGSEVYIYWVGGIIMAYGASDLYSFAIYVAAPTR